MQQIEVKKERKSHIFERDGLDWYQEESRASEGLFAVEKFEGAIYDPACGGGNIVRAALAAGYEAYGSDVVRRTDAEWFTREIDFLTVQIAGNANTNIVTNPPFFRGKGTEAFIRRALQYTSQKVAVFTSIGFLAGGSRADGLYREFPPHRVWFVTPRVSCPPGEWIAAGNKAGGGTDDWCWLVWDNAKENTGTQLGWIRKSKEPAQ